jgi:ribosomal protein L31
MSRKEEFESGKSGEKYTKLESMFDKAGVSMVKDPFTGTTHVDLSDPNHPFWTGKPGDHESKK